MSRTGAISLASLFAAALLGGCRPSTVRLAFAPRPGASYHYTLHIKSTSVTRLSGQAPRSQTDEIDLTAVDTVVTTDASGSRLRVVVSRIGLPLADYTVRIDRQAALVGIEAVNGEPAGQLSADLGGLQLQDLLPAAVGAPPGLALQAGDRWHTDEPLTVPDFQPARLVQTGRVERFGVVDGRRVAVTSADGTLALTPRPTRSTGGVAEVGLRGVEHTATTVTRVIDDGSIERSSAHTSGLFDIVLVSTTGPTGNPLVTGQIQLDVRSTTRRVA
ncbi:MAG TPA: hypothetical protein VNY84_03220 [Acidimicrobiales bacterium]|nr:hypothetical protein [Acidimicrobiales bacterium]